MATPTKTIRLRPKLRAEIERIARRNRRSFSDVAQTLLDEPLRAKACPGIYFADDAVSAHEVGNIEVGDEEQLVFAARHGRCLVSRNARDFRALSLAAVAQRRPHAGIVLCSPRLHGSDVGAVVTGLMKIAARSPRSLGEYDVLYL